MPTIEEAIEQFRKKRLAVYRADHDQIVRDTRVAERAAKDHVGRWLFELLQNSDDAEACHVRILVEDDAIYVADNGRGLKPEAVSAICGTDFSDKTTGTIGRKGVGFKSVYEVSSNPQVLTVNGEGVEFSPDRAGEWLKQSVFDDGHVPHQWIPFFVSWDDVRRKDPALDSLADYKTIVRLPGVSPDRRKKVEQLLKEWPPHALLAFRHVRRITAPHLEVVLTPGDEAWTLNDSRGGTPTSWLVAKRTEIDIPPELLEPLGTDERQAITANGVSFLIAAPLADGCVTPTGEYLPVHVFYPTEQRGPVRLLLHAEFLVKSDRTALIPIDDSPFNTWVAKSLSRQICRFVDGAFRLETPSSHAALLTPLEDRESHPVAEALWQQISEAAKAHLRLADVDGDQRLAVDEAGLVSVTVRPDLARKLLEATDVRGQLLHCSFDEDKDARKALKELSCREIRDQGVMEVIVENAASRADDAQWIWACWEWLAAWVGKQPYGDEHRDQVDQVRKLPIVPVAGRLLRPSDLAGRIVTWKPDGHAEDLHDWLPLAFIDDWFRDRIQGISEQESVIKKLHGELGIKEPGADVIQRAVGLAIEQYWKNKTDDPERFLCFMIDQDWHETSVASSALQRCPVPLLQKKKWAEDRKAYFGREWGNDLLANLYNGIETVAWVKYDGTEDAEGKHRRVLEWLGVADCPRIIKERGPRGNGFCAYELPEECRAWRTHAFEYTDRTPTVDSIGRLEGMAVKDLSDSQVCALLVLLAEHWVGYYQGRSQATLSWFYYTTRSHAVPAFWWYEILHEIRPAMKTGSTTCVLADCWLPDKRTERAIGDLLPVVDLDAFESDKDIVRNWLVTAVGIRTRIEQVTVQEWKELLSTRIPDAAPAERAASDERLRDKVIGWYDACLEAAKEMENVPEKAFAACPLLCRKGDSWLYVNTTEPRYLDDDNEFAKAFAGDAWLFTSLPG